MSVENDRLKELCQKNYQNSNRETCAQIEWNIKIAAQNIKRRYTCNNTANTKPRYLVELEDNPDIACIKWQHMFLGIVDYHAPCKRRIVGNVAP